LILLLASGCALAYDPGHSLIHWVDYADAAFSRAAHENRPVLVLISAFWCANCHIYEQNTLETPEVAALINERFVPVWVDYDKRQDVVRALGLSGVPMTLILAPNGERIVALPGYVAKTEFIAQLKEALHYLKTEFKPFPPEATVVADPRAPIRPTRQRLEAYLTRFDGLILSGFDPVYGGFGLAQKQPYADTLARLLELLHGGGQKWRDPLNTTLGYLLGLKQPPGSKNRPELAQLLDLRAKQRERLDQVDALQDNDRIAGIYDQAEGGFFRYAARRDWTAPHFEKTLQDNAELTDLMLTAYRVTGEKVYRKVAEASLNYILKNLYSPQDGRFFGSQAADAVYYHLTRQERSPLAPPPVDPTSYTAANARAVMTFLDAYQTLRDARYLAPAQRVLAFLQAHLIGDAGALSYYDQAQKTGVLVGQLRDNAWTFLALLRAYEVTQDDHYRVAANTLMARLPPGLYDRVSGGFYERRNARRDFYGKDDLSTTEKPFEENCIMAQALVHAYQLTGKQDYLRMAEATAGYLLSEIETGHFRPSSAHFQWVAQALLASGRYQ